MKKEKSPRKVDYESIKKISSSVLLDDIQTASFSANCTRPLAGYDAKNLRQEIAVKGNLSQVVENMGVVFIDFKYSNFHKEDNLANVTGTIVAVYAAGPDINWNDFHEESIQQFAEVNGIYNTWSYIRELVASSLTRLGLSGVLLPLWRPPATLPPIGEYAKKEYQPQNCDEDEHEEN